MKTPIKHFIRPGLLREVLLEALLLAFALISNKKVGRQAGFRETWLIKSQADVDRLIELVPHEPEQLLQDGRDDRCARREEERLRRAKSFPRCGMSLRPACGKKRNTLM